MNVVALQLPPRTRPQAELCVDRILALIDSMLMKADALMFKQENVREQHR
jgi:hypothetical protein